jgi:hypothetical protein
MGGSGIDCGVGGIGIAGGGGGGGASSSCGSWVHMVVEMESIS